MLVQNKSWTPRAALTLAVICILGVAIVHAHPPKHQVADDQAMHHHSRSKRSTAFEGEPGEQDDADFWIKYSQMKLREQLNKRLNTNRAKNVIMFMGDGMSIPTLAAARAYMGQLAGESGEEASLSFEKFPYTGLSKTYCVDKQVADSACSATAYLCGVKNNEGTIGVSGHVALKDCKAMANTSNHVDSIAQWAQEAGKGTGVVTTTRITHASPAGVYSHTANRDWESDMHVRKDGFDPDVCPDIAQQLIRSSPGKNFKVILGGGRKEFIPRDSIDEEGDHGYREDGINLIEEWQKSKDDQGVNYQYVWNRTELLKASEDKKLEYLLGLFESDHCQYHLDANPKTEPTLTEMVQAAITVLSREKKGYFLFVEGGRIDHAHHDNLARKALDETVQMAEAITAATEMTSQSDTLIVVTSDHAHTMAYAGYPDRGNSILQIAGIDDDKLPYATLSYSNGPGFRPVDEDGHRHNLHNDDMYDKDYKFPALAPLGSETHGGDDVAVFALGPWAHLFTGMYEQSVIPHMMGFASCCGKGLTVCDLQHAGLSTNIHDKIHKYLHYK